MIMFFLQIFHLYCLFWKKLLSILLIFRLDFIFNFLPYFPSFSYGYFNIFSLDAKTQFEMSLFKIKLESGYKKLS